jgi:hypothetical protein
VLTKVTTLAKIDGHGINVHWDSGASLSVLSRPAAARAGIRPSSENVTSGGIGYGVFGGGLETSLAPFGSFAIGDEEVQNTRLRVADIELQDADMLLGADFFLSHRILISRSQDKIYFTYNGGPVFRLDREARQVQADGSKAPHRRPTSAPRPRPSSRCAEPLLTPGATSRRPSPTSPRLSSSIPRKPATTRIAPWPAWARSSRGPRWRTWARR